MNTQEIVDVLKQAKEGYYNNGESNLTDKEFDDLENELKELDPTNEYFKMVGIDTYGKKIKHAYQMKSIDKVNSFDDLKEWLRKRSRNVSITPKYDGLSFTAKYENGEIEYLATRGDGTEGQDISHIISNLDSLFDKSDELYNLNFEIRGELIIKKEYQEYFKNKPLRNIVVGLCNRKDNLDDCKYISTIIYDVIGLEFENEEEKFKWLDKYFKNVTINAVFYDSIDDVDDFIKDWEDKLRNEFIYELDGLVITLNKTDDKKEWIGNHDHHWDYNVAYKFKAMTAISNLKNIEWNVSRYGYLIPVGIFEPIIIQNRKIERATLCNYENVKKLNLEIGDEILISLSGDVIPYIEKNIKKNIFQRKIK